MYRNNYVDYIKTVDKDNRKLIIDLEKRVAALERFITELAVQYNAHEHTTLTGTVAPPIMHNVSVPIFNPEQYGEMKKNKVKNAARFNNIDV